MKFCGYVAALAVVGFLGGVAWAEDDKPADKPSTGRAAGADRRAEFLKKYDKDGDGKLSEEERAAVRAEFLKQYDKDGDGKLSEEERKALPGGGRGPGGRGPGGRGGAEFLKRFDKDGDGKLSDDERAAAREEFKKRGGGERKKRPAAE